MQTAKTPSAVPRSTAALPQRPAPAQHLQRALGNRALGTLLQRERRGIQTKLAISHPGDRYEQEADRVADRVMRMTAPATVQRKCTACEESDERLHCKPKAEHVTSNNHSGVQSADPLLSVVNRAVGTGGGRPLDAATRNFFEPRFGCDFGQVRVHTDARAADASQALSARAFTLGHNIYFGAGEYRPTLSEKQQLLAHELTHIVQQTSDGRAPHALAPTNRTEHPAAPIGQMGCCGPTLQRRVIEGNVSCRLTGLHGGVPGGVLTGPAVVAAIREADGRAIDLARRAENLLFLQRITFGTGLYAPDAALDTALANRFGLSMANAADRRTIAIIEREYQAVANYLASGAIHYVCRGPDCDPGDWAYTYHGQRTVYFCSPFYSEPSLNLRGSTLLHEVMHVWWNQVDDQGHRPLHNAHCFEQFALDLAGATAEIPPAFAAACVV